MNTKTPVLLRTEHSQHQSVHNIGTKMVHLKSKNAYVRTSLWKWSKCTFVLPIRHWAPGKLCQSQKFYQESAQSKMSPFNWEEKIPLRLAWLLRRSKISFQVTGFRHVDVLQVSWTFIKTQPSVFLKVTKRSCCLLTCRSGIDQWWGE